MLAEVVEICLCPGPLVVDPEDLGYSVLEVNESFEDMVSLGGPLVWATLEELPLSGLELL